MTPLKIGGKALLDSITKTLTYGDTMNSFTLLLTIACSCGKKGADTAQDTAQDIEEQIEDTAQESTEDTSESE